MIRKTKKNKGFRGYKTHGWGSHKKHRGSGNRGGFGMAGSGKKADQRKSYILKKYGNTYFGKHGFVRHSGIVKRELRIMNVGELNKLDKQEINLSEMGYDKLLGAGIVKKKMKVIVGSASESAVEKIKKLGGDVIIKE